MDIAKTIAEVDATIKRRAAAGRGDGSDGAQHTEGARRGRARDAAEIGPGAFPKPWCLHRFDRAFGYASLVAEPTPRVAANVRRAPGRGQPHGGRLLVPVAARIVPGGVRHVASSFGRGYTLGNTDRNHLTAYAPRSRPGNHSTVVQVLVPYNPSLSYLELHDHAMGFFGVPQNVEARMNPRTGMLRDIPDRYGLGGDHCVYLLTDMTGDYTYIGRTSRNPRQRLKEHNTQNTKKRAYTHNHRPWVMLFSVHGFLDAASAGRFERAWKGMSVGAQRRFHDSSLRRQVQLLLLLVRHEWCALTVCGQWGRLSPGMYTGSVPARNTYTVAELQAAGFCARDALVYAVDGVHGYQVYPQQQ